MPQCCLVVWDLVSSTTAAGLCATYVRLPFACPTARHPMEFTIEYPRKHDIVPSLNQTRPIVLVFACCCLVCSQPAFITPHARTGRMQPTHIFSLFVRTRTHHCTPACTPLTHCALSLYSPPPIALVAAASCCLALPLTTRSYSCSMAAWQSQRVVSRLP
jgi:hypothetical protein